MITRRLVITSQRYRIIMFRLSMSDLRYVGHRELTPEEKKEARIQIAKFEDEFLLKNRKGTVHE